MKIVTLSSGHEMLVDDEDFEWMSKIRWKALKNHRKGNVKIYAATPGNQSRLAHRLILNAPKGMLVDHIDGNPLNNQRANLRLCNNSQNHANLSKYPGTHKYKGVRKQPRIRKQSYTAAIRHNYRTAYVSGFEDEDVAALQYDVMAILLFDEFAQTNFPRWCAELVLECR